MTKNTQEYTNTSLDATHLGITILHMTLAVLFTGLGWLFAGRLQYTGWTLGVAAVLVMMSFVLVRGYAGLRLPREWTYRSAVLSGICLALVLWIMIILGGNSPAGYWVLPAWLLAAFSGGLLATGFYEGLQENNSPPGRAVQEEVLRQHRQEMGGLLPAARSKRAFDVILSGLGLLLSLPLWLLFSFLIWFESPGPLIFVKNSVGKGGRNFHQYKFRTMVPYAESATGPVLAEGKDERILRIGSFLRITALDELPQLINILKGEMSFVGPRPQRTVMVHTYLQEIPGYAARHRLSPGLAGLAQVAGGYHISPREKLEWDLLYLQRASLKYDLRLVFLAFFLVFWVRWRKGDTDLSIPPGWLDLD